MSSRTRRAARAAQNPQDPQDGDGDGPDWNWDFDSDEDSDASGPADAADHDSDRENEWEDVDAQSGDDGDEDAIIKMPPQATRRRDANPKAKTGKAAEKENVMKAYFDLLPAGLQNTVILYASNLMKLEPKCRRWMSQNLPVRTQASMVETLEAVQYDQYWTEVDEQALQANWKKDPIRRDWWDLDTRKQNRAIIPLWKTFSRLFRVLPDEVITRDACLEYGSKGNNWTAKFCTRLQSVAVHPIFGADFRLLRLGLLYVVMCRTDYRGIVPWKNSTSDRFLSRFVREMEKNDGSKTIVQARQSARRYFREEDKEFSSLWDLLFESIEKKAFQRKRDHPNVVDPLPIFQITTEDLASLHKSINSVKVLGLPVFWLVAIFSRLVKHSVSDWGAPRGRLGLYKLRKAVELKKRRESIIQERKEAAGIAPADLVAGSVPPAGSASGTGPPASSAARTVPPAGSVVPPREVNWYDEGDNQISVAAIDALSEQQAWDIVAKKIGAEAANAAKATADAYKIDVVFSNDEDIVMNTGNEEDPPLLPPAELCQTLPSKSIRQKTSEVEAEMAVPALIEEDFAMAPTLPVMSLSKDTGLTRKGEIGPDMVRWDRNHQTPSNGEGGEGDPEDHLGDSYDVGIEEGEVQE